MSEREVTSVSWINVTPHNRREKLARWWQEDVRQGSTYTSERQRNEEFQTVIPVDGIARLACEGLKRALYDQKRDIEEMTDTITFPRATPDGELYFGSIAISSRPLGARITERGIVPIPDENH